MINNKRKILHLITGLELGGGAENILLQLLPKIQVNLDNRVCVIKGRGEIGKKLEAQNIKVYYLDLKNIFDLGIIFRYRKILKDLDPDIQVNYLIHADIFGRIFGKIFRVKRIVPYIRNIHRNKKFLMFLDKITLPLSTFVLTNSETAKKYYLEKMGVKSEKIRCISNGIDLSRFENLHIDVSEKKKEIGIPGATFVIGTVARLEKQKNLPTLIKAFALVSEKNSKTHLLIVGYGSEKENLKNLIKELKIETRTTMLEKRTDILGLISIMDIFVLPSLNEGMSNAILEAMALKKLIITSNIKENTELIEDGKEGYNFENSNAGKLSGIIRKVILGNQDLEKIRSNAFGKIYKKYNLNIIKIDFENFLRNI